ncbi:HD-GYP domain-containing protein [Aestuariibacter sp. AA17]|uniref:HD-GYP domain-containing protein n=1 Tax=Fluctibacter corallii TaxID=2984329 RepID=A0ABT3A8B0_9ALTE|nr:HD-GYP domain-containing protein [Aestuariibacter sp. AA17]MCV2884814.1 HD-GYP domain-containing protein [Aestuariibacter sp. AA17]
MLKPVSIHDLTPGMYVNGVLEQKGDLKVKSKGLVKTQQTINGLKDKGVLMVEVDYAKSKLPEPMQAPPKGETSSSPAQAPLSAQMERAEQLTLQAKTIQREFFQKIKENGHAELYAMQDLSLDVIDCVIECPHTLSCLALLNRADNYYFEHSLNCSTLMAMFANHLEFDKECIEDLSFAALVMDIGMANVPMDIINKKGKLTKPEMDVVSTHVDIGLDIIERCGEVSHIVREVIFAHHERCDGSGYPDQKAEDELSQYVKMAAIVDSYDAMTRDRPYRKALSPTKALQEMLVDDAYDRQLVQSFIQCLGVHPVGSLVKLDNDRLGIVIRANKKQPLKPTVITFYHVKSAHYSETKIYDLRKTDTQIESSVRPEEFNINLQKFFKEVLVNNLD